MDEVSDEQKKEDGRKLNARLAKKRFQCERQEAIIRKLPNEFRDAEAKYNMRNSYWGESYCQQYYDEAEIFLFWWIRKFHPVSNIEL
jgi:hypothetical protein